MKEHQPAIATNLMLRLKTQDFCVWLAYITMLVLTVPRHEPWNDEAQAWLLARASTISQLVLHRLRYESHPSLWYLILWVPTHLHLSYSIFCWISALIAAAGIYIFLRFSPFPFYLRAVFPFTFFLAYQYAVVARSYALFPLLCFLIAYFWRSPRPRPLALAVLLGLLANVSIHGTLVACALAPVYVWNLLRSPGAPQISWRSCRVPAIVFLALVGLAAFTVLPPPRDLTTVATPTVLRDLHLPDNQANVAPLGQHLAVKSVAAAPAQHAGGLGARLHDIPRVVSYSVAPSHYLAFAVYLAAFIFLYQRKQLLLLAPLLILALFLSFIYARYWHLGLLWVTLLMVLWIAWDKQDNNLRLSAQSALGVLLFFTSLLQFPWTWQAVRYDIRSPYSGAKQTAEYLHTLPPSVRIAGFDPQSTAILPYFAHNIFFNQPSAYWLWSTRNTVDSDAPETIASHPDVVVVFQETHNASTESNPVLDYVHASGYRETHRFCGQMAIPGNQQKERGCYVTLGPARN